VHASGDFSARPPPGSAARRTGRLEPEALQALLARVLVQHRFASISATAIGSEISQISQRTGRLFQVMDGGETEIEPLRRLHAIKQALLALAHSAR
jgi:hypothetical protein